MIGRLTHEYVYRGDGLNLYAYYGNHLVGYYDPSGYEHKSVWNKITTKIQVKIYGCLKFSIYPVDGEKLVEKEGKNGKFIGCNNYPRCK